MLHHLTVAATSLMIAAALDLYLLVVAWAATVAADASVVGVVGVTLPGCTTRGPGSRRVFISNNKRRHHIINHKRRRPLGRLAPGVLLLLLMGCSVIALHHLLHKPILHTVMRLLLATT